MGRRYIGSIVIGWLLLLVGLLATPIATTAATEEGWTVPSFHSAIVVQSNGNLDVTEAIHVDFANLQRHGIVRDVPVVYDYNQTQNRIIGVSVISVTDQNGSPIPYTTQRNGSFLSIRIGDPNRLVSGTQTYVLHYLAEGALNGFADHDELYWNVTGGDWTVPIQQAAATVSLPGPGLQRVTCYEGTTGSTQTCQSSSTKETATFTTTRSLPPGEQLTIVVGFAKGLVPNPITDLEAKPRPASEFVQLTPSAVGVAGLVALLTFGWISWSWWRFGRDRRYRTMYYLTDNPSEETKPLLTSDPIVIEYQPTENLRPAEIGLLLDESADPLDATATIVDLAVRGYLRITEVQSTGLFGHLFGKTDWEIAKTEKESADLLDYEAAMYRGLFAQGSSVRLSDLKYKLAKPLQEAQGLLYTMASKKKWFTSRPDRARMFWLLLGLGVAVLGGIVAIGLGMAVGGALVGLPLVVGGLVLMIISHWMPKRTAHGHELLRRILGFRLYVATAETSRQRYNEQQNIFAAYLPYAIVFHCVDKWARAFSDAERQAATQSWFIGPGPFTAVAFSQRLQSFSSGLTSTIVSTPGGRGSSGFSGGGSGFGVGGGGGHSW